MRDRLIKLIKHCTSCEECRDEDIADHLLANGVTVRNEWISVEVRLPDELFYHNLVAYIDEDGDRQIGIAAYQGNGFWSGVSFFDNDCEITHWMPLPEPPKERDHK